MGYSRLKEVIKGLGPETDVVKEKLDSRMDERN